MCKRSLTKAIKATQLIAGPCESGSGKFEKWKVKNKSLHSFSRGAKWKKMLSLFFEKWKVKSKCFEIEIEKWKFSRILNNSRETRFLNRFIPWKPNKTAETMACSWGNNHGHFHNLTILKSESSLTNLLYCRHLILVTYIGNSGSESFFETIFWLRSTRPREELPHMTYFILK